MSWTSLRGLAAGAAALGVVASVGRGATASSLVTRVRDVAVAGSAQGSLSQSDWPKATLALASIPAAIAPPRIAKPTRMLVG